MDNFNIYAELTVPQNPWISDYDIWNFAIFNIFSMNLYTGDIWFLAGYICKMKNIKKLIVIEGILFLVAGIITVLVGKFTVDRYGTTLLLCGVVAMAIGVVSQAGSRHRPMPYSYRPEISVSEQHLRDKKDLQSNITFFFKSFVVGIIPVVIGLILMHLSN